MEITEYFGIIKNYVPTINMKLLSSKKFTNIRLSGLLNLG